MAAAFVDRRGFSSEPAAQREKGGAMTRRWLLSGLATTTLALLLGSGCDAPLRQRDGGPHDASDARDAGMDAGVEREGPSGNDVNLHPHEVGDAVRGREVFRFQTFGNEAFWTDAVQLPQGIIAAGLTPLQMLRAGYSVDVDALDEGLAATLAAELQTDLGPAMAPTLNDPATTLALIEANAVIGMVAVDSSGDGTIDLRAGDRVGLSCAFCHATTDGSVFSMPRGGSVGRELDGPTPHALDLGATFALAANTRALYPLAQLALTANGDITIGRASIGLTELSTEAELDAYFNNRVYYPVGTFDDQPDGNGASVHIAPAFRADLSAPYGSEGAVSRLDDYSNLVYTVLLDLRTITTPGGRAFLRELGGAAGIEIVFDYLAVLAATGVDPRPAIEIATTGTPGTERTPAGVRVDDARLLDLNAYVDGLAAPSGHDGDAASLERGLTLFRHLCTSCHNVDQSRFVPSMIVPMEVIFPGDDPIELMTRNPPLNPVLDTTHSHFDDRMVTVNASLRGDVRGIALPLLLDLRRRPSFLHDDSVRTLDGLLDASRGPDAPHPFYLSGGQRQDVIVALRSFDTD